MITYLPFMIIVNLNVYVKISTIEYRLSLNNFTAEKNKSIK